MPTIVKFRMAEGAEDLAPYKAHHDDAGYDLHASNDMILSPHTVKLVPTGLYLELPEGFEAQVRPRSGLALKHGITILNAPGTIDAGYRGEVGVILFNALEEPFKITRGTRIAQMIVQRLPEVELVSADVLAESVRGDGGFGSTGHN